MLPEQSLIAKLATTPGPLGWLAKGDWVEIATGLICVGVIWTGPSYGIVLIATGLFFGNLESAFPFRRTNVLHRAWQTDAYHFVISTASSGAAVGVIIATLGPPLRSAAAPHLASVRAQPLALQVVETFLLMDGIDYFFHRLSHALPLLWRFHQVHHTMENLNWLESYRAHPVDKALNGLITVLPIYVLGLWSWPFVLIFFGVVDSINTPWAHGNLKVSLGPLWWVVRNPEFHRWHHARSEVAMNSNFAQMFPIWDIVFGTCHMPRGEAPEAYGLPYATPARYVDQLTMPFRAIPTRPEIPTNIVVANLP